ncbi:hypothetical protein SmJEL517_g06248 [Synchytrium microbalum]|uniref:HECT-type E3 ubiquitin transferase n=1 Tax=Synchytrium microbalum TaxID=1806994 RepID=A0A507BXN8_9FUNG|nr:uncharacterized protein SmJEL517_g06248 [Synchytrium microbalum]TPX30115.1 hypothetical protein SmJEL517_g06248 [Synchytrium microbalum]
MTFFDGSYKKPRNVNLGNRSTITQRDLLLKAQIERENREQERLRWKCAIKIESFWRGRREVQLAKDAERLVWDSSALDLIHIHRQTQSLLFFFNPRLDLGRLDALSTALLAADRNGTITPVSAHVPMQLTDQTLTQPVPLFVSAFLQQTPSFVSEWIYLLEKLLLLCVANSIINDNGIVLNLADYCVTGGLYRSIGEYLGSIATERKLRPLVSLMVDVVNQTLNLPLTIGHSRAFASEILTIPLLPLRIPLDAVSTLSATMPFDVILREIAAADLIQLIKNTNKVTETDGVGSLLTNILMFGQSRISTMSPETLFDYVTALQKLLLSSSDLFFERRDPTVLDASIDLGDEDEIMMPLNSQKASKPTLDRRLLKWLNILFDPAHMTAIMRLMTTVALTSVSVVDSIAPIVNFFLALIDRWPGRKLEVMAIVGATGDIVGILCDKLMPAWEARFGGRVSFDAITDPSNASLWSVLVFVCELYSRMLMTMGDDEFFGEKTSLKLNMVVSLSRVLKNVTFGLYWNDSGLVAPLYISGTTLVMQLMRQLFTQLLFSLHSRDSRRPFAPPNHWLSTSEIDLPSFMAAAVLDDSGDLSSRQMRVVGPRQAILNNTPFVIPFENRVSIFREEGIDNEWHMAVASATIRRKYIFEDGYTYLNALGPRLKNKIAITFVDDNGMVEAGIDGGGLFKEFLTGLSKQAFDMNYGLMCETKDHLLYPSPQSYATQEAQLLQYQFLGRILGKALYEGVLVDVSFAKFFLSKWLGRQSYLDDLPSLDPELYQSLMFLKNYTGDVEKDLTLTFTKDENEFGTTRSIELIPGGGSIPVTRDNRIRYIYLVANYWLNQQIDKQCRAFFHGLVDLIDPRWLKMFNQEELQILIGGASMPIDLRDLQQHIDYQGGFSTEHPTIKAFWKVVDGFSEEEKQLLLKFVTSCARPPLLGFGALRPLLCIRNAGDEEERLPSASTCVNLLKLPAYKSAEKLNQKLIYAITSNAGFDLS